MVFRQTPRAKLEEELMTAVSFYDLFARDVEKVISEIRDNERADHANDVIRGEVTQHLLSALGAYNRKDYEDCHKFIHAAAQRLNAQEILDLKDDRPRNQALITLSILQEKSVRYAERLRAAIALLNDRGDD